MIALGGLNHLRFVNPGSYMFIELNVYLGEKDEELCAGTGQLW